MEVVLSTVIRSVSQTQNTFSLTFRDLGCHEVTPFVSHLVLATAAVSQLLLKSPGPPHGVRMHQSLLLLKTILMLEIVMHSGAKACLAESSWPALTHP